jgi:hypothetical protein
VLETVTKYWPVLTVVALATVSVFNIGYFSIVGLHFIGVMDLSNIVYAVALVFGLIIAPLVMFPDGLVDRIKEFSSDKDFDRRAKKGTKIATWFLALSFAVGLFIHQPYISITGLFALYFVAAYIVVAAYSYAVFLRHDDISVRHAFGLLALGMFTIFWVGGAVGYNQAFGTTTLYKLTTKDAEYDKIRLVRSSSSGFIITREKQVIYVPSGELKLIVQLTPIE